MLPVNGNSVEKEAGTVTPALEPELVAQDLAHRAIFFVVNLPLEPLGYRIQADGRPAKRGAQA
jgi:hypothetical protein